jgi:GDP-L-fucose synthase
MSRILITGASGLIGSQIIKKNKNSIALNSKVCDLRDKKSTDEVFNLYTDVDQQKEFVVDRVIHCAARVGGLGGNLNYKGEFFYDNIMINTNVIEACRKYGIKKLVCFLSTCIFPDKVEYPLTEDKVHLGPPHFSNYPYAYAKRMADIQMKAYREQYGLKYTSVIPTNIYGPNDNFNLENSHVIPALIHKCFLAKENNSNLEIWGTGKPLREFIFSKDVAELSLWVLENYDESEPIILSTSNEISIKDLATLIADLMGFKNKIIWDASKPDGQLRKPTDNSKLKKYLPNFEFTKIEDGIKETLDWFYDNYNSIRK